MLDSLFLVNAENCHFSACSTVFFSSSANRILFKTQYFQNFKFTICWSIEFDLSLLDFKHPLIDIHNSLKLEIKVKGIYFKWFQLWSICHVKFFFISFMCQRESTHFSTSKVATQLNFDINQANIAMCSSKDGKIVFTYLLKYLWS